jgi:hypothetical protein
MLRVMILGSVRGSMSSWLCRRTVRKGFPFPMLPLFYSI